MSNYFQTVFNVSLMSDHILCATLMYKGIQHSSQIDLNDFIGNVDGKLVWGGRKPDGKRVWRGRDFSKTARSVRVKHVDKDHCILTAVLKAEDGDLVDSQINLAERIRNREGNLEFV